MKKRYAHFLTGPDVRRALIVGLFALGFVLWVGLGYAATDGTPLKLENDVTAQEEKELKLTGQYFEYDHARGVAIVKDGAFVEMDGLKVWGDNIHGDLHHSLFYAEGNVVFWRGDEKYSARSFSYNTKTHRGTATDLKTQRGPAIIKAQRLTLEPYRMMGWDVSTTTDTKEVPSYRVDAKKMVMIPRKRIIFKNAKFKVGERTVFRLPTYILNLENPEKVNRLNLVPGWNPGRGFYLQSSWDFYFAEPFYGRLYYNPSQYQGTDAGLNFNYALSPRSGGKFDYTLFHASNIAQKYSRYDLKHNYTISQEANASLGALLTENEYSTGGVERKLNVNSVVNRNTPEWTTSLTYDKLINLDSGLDPGTDLVQYVSSTPRLTFSQNRPHSLFGESLTYRVDGAVSRITERTLDSGDTGTLFSYSDITNRNASLREISATKSEVNLSFSPRPLTLGDISRISYNVRDSQMAYSTGDLRNFFSFLVNTNEQWTRHFSTGFDYVFQNVAGSTPFATFDRLEPDRHLLTSYIRAQNRRWFTGTLFQTQYDIYAKSYRSASSNFVFRAPSQEERSWNLALTPIYEFDDPYSLSSIGLNSVAANLQLTKPDRWSHAFITNYMHKNSRIESVATSSDFLLGETMRAEIASNLAYNSCLAKFDVTKLNLGLTKDLGAWEARLKWNTLQKEVYLEFYLKFAAKKRLQVGVNYATDQLQYLSPDQVRNGLF